MEDWFSHAEEEVMVKPRLDQLDNQEHNLLSLEFERKVQDENYENFEQYIQLEQLKQSPSPKNIEEQLVDALAAEIYDNPGTEPEGVALDFSQYVSIKVQQFDYDKPEIPVYNMLSFINEEQYQFYELTSFLLILQERIEQQKPASEALVYGQHFIEQETGPSSQICPQHTAVVFIPGLLGSLPINVQQELLLSHFNAAFTELLFCTAEFTSGARVPLVVESLANITSVSPFVSYHCFMSALREFIVIAREKIEKFSIILKINSCYDEYFVNLLLKSYFGVKEREFADCQLEDSHLSLQRYIVTPVAQVLNLSCKNEGVFGNQAANNRQTRRAQIETILEQIDFETINETQVFQNLVAPSTFLLNLNVISQESVNLELLYYWVLKNIGIYSESPITIVVMGHNYEFRTFVQQLITQEAMPRAQWRRFIVILYQPSSESKQLVTELEGLVSSLETCTLERELMDRHHEVWEKIDFGADKK